MKRLSVIVPLFVAVVVAALGPAVGRTARSATPYLQLTGTIPIAGQATVASGDTATAYGSGFCGAAGCSTVTLRVGDRVAARGVDVGGNGSFRTTFTVVEDPGRYTVTASQRAADGATLEDSATLVVAVADVEQQGPEVSLQVLSASNGVFRTSVQPGRCCRRGLVFFQRRISVGHWRLVKRVRLNRKATRRFEATLHQRRLDAGPLEMPACELELLRLDVDALAALAQLPGSDEQELRAGLRDLRGLPSQPGAGLGWVVHKSTAVRPARS